VSRNPPAATSATSGTPFALTLTGA